MRLSLASELFPHAAFSLPIGRHVRNTSRTDQSNSVFALWIQWIILVLDFTTDIWITGLDSTDRLGRFPNNVHANLKACNLIDGGYCFSSA
ncbi:hypothetical protein CQZ93_17710 [Ochrobactrum vermis]|nr:hypothetical protein CQZ93_17710 [Ochrobactrum vermis]